VSHVFSSLVLSEGEVEDNMHHDAEDIAAAADDDDDNDDDNKNNNGTSMPPKVKPMAAAKKPAATTETMTLPAPRPPSNFSVDAANKFGIAYYCEGTQDFADVAIHVNGCLYESDYCMSIAQDGMSVWWQRSINSLCYTKEILALIMGNAYSPSNHRAVAYNDIAQEMFAKIIRPKNKYIWGTVQVMRIKWECTGTPTILKRNYAIDYIMVNLNGRRNYQQNMIIIIKLKKAKEPTTEAEVNVVKIDFFGPFSQGSSNPSPPCNAGRGLMREKVTREKDTRWTATTTTRTRMTMATGEGRGEGEVDTEEEREGRRGISSCHSN
jgi:hypothetical protein